MHTSPLADRNLFLIDLDLPRDGFRQFISAWLYRQGEATILVDPGPRSTYPALRKELQNMGIQRIDAVLLTHIHIDHAGSAGLALLDYPQAKVICHPKSFRHLSDPSRLWEESQKILGFLAADYGQIEAVPAKVLMFEETIVLKDMLIEAMDTPGHAPHHLCFKISDILFTGELLGITCPHPELNYSRPATPLGGRIGLLQKSIKQTAEVNAAYLCYGHYGLRENCTAIWSSALTQIGLWLTAAQEHGLAQGEPAEEEVFAWLVDKDPLFGGFYALPPDIQVRERFFVGNSIRGMGKYLQEQKNSLKPL
jgi:glyoxylase-like metal-dependent hydrolase (beta-lactamase superfamily II)